MKIYLVASFAEYESARTFHGVFTAKEKALKLKEDLAFARKNYYENWDEDLTLGDPTYVNEEIEVLEMEVDKVLNNGFEGDYPKEIKED